MGRRTRRVRRKSCQANCPWRHIRPNELSLLKQKAKHLGDMEGYEIATLRYEEMLHPLDAYYNHYTAEEAAEILRKLTPPGFES